MNMRVLYSRCAAIDVHKDQVTVAVRTPGEAPGGRHTEVRKFRAFYGVLIEMARWLVSLQVTRVAMEATGIYTMPVYHALIEHGRFEQVLVCNAAHVKNVPGRKTDAVDATWLAELLECGLLGGSFIPKPKIKAVRDVARYRKKLVGARTSEIQRLGAVLQDAGIKLDSVASSIATVSGRAMIEALIDGERRPAVLAELARGRMRAKIADLTLALHGRFGAHHGLMCQLHLEHIDHLEEMIARLDTQVDQMMIPFARQRDLLVTIPGIGPIAAAAILSEIGASPAELFPAGRTWPPGQGCARATTNRPANVNTAPLARATSTSNPSWSKRRGRRCAPTADYARATTASCCASVATAIPRRRRRRSSPSPTPSSS
jgi:transposase